MGEVGAEQNGTEANGREWIGRAVTAVVVVLLAAVAGFHLESIQQDRSRLLECLASSRKSASSQCLQFFRWMDGRTTGRRTKDGQNRPEQKGLPCLRPGLLGHLWATYRRSAIVLFQNEGGRIGCQMAA